MRCSDVAALWDSLREGLDTPRESVLEHLRRCTTCQGLYREYEGVAYCLSCLPVVEPPIDLVPKILDHLRSMRPRRSGRPDSLAVIASPLGPLYVAFRESGITFVGFSRGDDDETREMIERRLRRHVVPSTAPAWVAETIERFFRDWSVDRQRVDISDLTEFERAALATAATIPAGEVRSYGWIASEIGHPQSARAVGQVMARNPVALLYPCHRVVDCNGGLNNYAYGVEIKRRILELEGALVPAPRSNRR